MSKYWVTMTDKFLSGWGMAQDKIAKYVYECDTLEMAQKVKSNAEKRTDQKNINITTSKPRYNLRTHYTQYRTYDPTDYFYRNTTELIA